MTNSISIICFFNGSLGVGVNNLPVYDGGSRKMFMLSKSCNFDGMTREIHRVTKIKKEEYTIRVFFNCPINESRTIAVEITEDEELNDMKQLVEKQASIELFIEKYPIQEFAQVSRPQGEFSRMLDLDNESIGFMTSPSQEPWSQPQHLSEYSIGGTSTNIFNDASGHVTGYPPVGAIIEDEADDDSDHFEEDGVQIDSMHVAAGIDDDARWMEQFNVNNDYVEAEDPLPDEFHNEDWINTSQAGFVDVGPNLQRPEDFTFKKGDLFESKEALIFAIREWSIKNRVKFKPVKTNATNYNVKCFFNDKNEVENANEQDERNKKCPWLLNAAVRKSSNGQFVICRYCGLHTCCNPSVDVDDYSASSSYICKLIMPEVRAELDLNAGQIFQKVYDMRGIKISKYKAYDARRKALSKIFGDWEKSYELLPRYLKAIKRNNPGTEYEILSEEIAPGMERFTRVFWAFGPAIKGFTFCRPLLSIDGTHLYGKYKGVLLVATGVDANGGLFPLAFAVVEVEDTSSWKWFFELIYKWIPSVRAPRIITFISDRMKGIIRALHEGFSAPHHHQYCLRHIRDNFKKKHGEINLQNLL
ncbi:uncharacterized protein LOC109825375 [Asparagus officinalis]|uniref:uncharacterized protein LOC109825375 n=1 Tax=Asparagus officinalis TaxID=4686 RepID=UPI00098DE35B|nr:uncharacterized protein LOC109825375 [Asparagus officinalis]